MFDPNVRSQKSDDSNLASSNLNAVFVTEGTLSDLEHVYKKMMDDFPEEELLDRTRTEELMVKGHYHLLIARHTVSDEMIGYAFLYEPSDVEMIWLDYMAIDKKFQNAGYGTVFFKELSRHRSEANLGVFLEVEMPHENIDQERRIAFYERLGAIRLSVQYELPTKTGSMPMYLYFRPASSVNHLTTKMIKKSIDSAVMYIHGDKPQHFEVLEKMNRTITDENFKTVP